jgi:hypothetical protein
MVKPKVGSERFKNALLVCKVLTQGVSESGIHIVYGSGTDFFRWKILRVRDLLRGFFLSLLTVRPRERDPLASSPMYLSL